MTLQLHKHPKNQQLLYNIDCHLQLIPSKCKYKTTFFWVVKKNITIKYSHLCF